ncbi:helix-turn-helix transcriptional regulator [Metaclostridioides mangenotii]|uniref:helix-turn-helix transcriptional regulator n=1 Tax=Metaclostridioides mangenotii TaxID=1540 RepID=UPI002149FD72|nr:helix-turn-helix transcriptional regulator [Clostridioides mangenotii]
MKRLRKEKNLRQIDVANVIGVKKTTYASKENGERRFTLEEADALAEYFNVDLREVFLNKKSSI